MMPFEIADLPAPNGGTLGICPLPGRDGAALKDFAAITAWRPDIVVSMTETAEMERHDVADMGKILARDGIAWVQFAIPDFGTPQPGAPWPALASRLHLVLNGGGRVLAQCYGGKGRSGMVLFRLMVERGMDAGLALCTLRAARPGAVETEAQRIWAAERDCDAK